MDQDIRQFLREEAAIRLEGSPGDAILDVPIEDLTGFTRRQVTELSDRGMLTVRDLGSDEGYLAIGRLQLKPPFRHALICVLFHPQHDPGPDCEWEDLFRQAPLDHYVNYPGSPFHTRFGPVFYRGRLDGSARVLVIGQDPAVDETLGMRAFVGQAGQRAQAFLAKLGLTRSYVMFNTFLFGGQSDDLTEPLLVDPVIMGYRNRLFDHVNATSELVAIIAFGSPANQSALNWTGRGSLPIVAVTHPSAPFDFSSNWNQGLTKAAGLIAPDAGAPVDLSPFPSPPPAADVPRRDLPFGIPSWHGTGGRTAGKRGPAFETQIMWTAP